MPIYFQESALRSIATTITATHILDQNSQPAGPDIYLVQSDNIMLVNQSQAIQIREQQEEIQRLQQQIFDMRAVEERRFAIAYQRALQERDHALSEMEFMRFERDQALFLCEEAENLRNEALRERDEQIWEGEMEGVVGVGPEKEEAESSFGTEKGTEEKGKGKMKEIKEEQWQKE